MTVEPPFLRTLAPLLRGLEQRLRGWLDTTPIYPVSSIARASVEGLADDLRRKSEALDVDRPLLVVMLMGGTGVGKSTLMNALAGAAVAQASFTRPTTRDPVVYFHQSVNPEQLDPALRLCRLVRHDRPSLAQKVIVDTPDLDSNDRANRDKLLAVLPVADVVLYVGSQEKYHDQLGWELFKTERQRRAFAFVLNKWDRCLHPGATGLRPDQDLLKDLQAEGFAEPKLFRTTAQIWLDAAQQGTRPAADQLPPGEQFAELLQWLELGLTRQEIEAVKARGVGQLLQHVQETTTTLRPPDMTAATKAVRDSWAKLLNEESRATSEVLLSTLDPRQKEIEHQFSLRGQQRFRGLMAAYLRFTTKLRYVSRPLKDRIPLPGRRDTETPEDWDSAALAHGCARAAGEVSLDQRRLSLGNRLLVDADQRGFPLLVLNDRVLAVAKLDWDDRYTRSVMDALSEVEREYTTPSGTRAMLRNGVTWLVNYLPEGLMLTSVCVLLWQWIGLSNLPTFAQMLMPLYVLIGTMVLLHVLIALVFTLRWSVIREQFQDRLEAKLTGEYRRNYLPLLDEIAAGIAQEAKAVETLTAEARDVAEWLTARESAAQVRELYGKSGDR